MTTTYDYAATTPRGRRAVFVVRADTNDENTVRSAVDQDEYRLRDVDLGDGVALDVGAHIGSVAVTLALDNPAARVIAVEALGANCELLRENLARNGVVDRVAVVHAAVARGRSARMAWNYAGSESATHHRFIGNAALANGADHQIEIVPTVSLAALIRMAGGEIAFAKVDCENCEYDLLRGVGLGKVRRFVGEFHSGSERIAAALRLTHDVTLAEGNLGHFAAVRR